MRTRYRYDEASGKVVEVIMDAPSAPRLSIIKDIDPYLSPVTGDVIGSRSAHRDDLRRHGCHVLEKGEKEAAVRARQDRERDIDRKVEGWLRQT